MNPPPPPPPLEPSAAAAVALLQLARHVELAAGGAHRVDPTKLCQVLQRLGYSAKLHESTAPLHRFKRGVVHQYVAVCLPSECAPRGSSPQPFSFVLAAVHTW